MTDRTSPFDNLHRLSRRNEDIIIKLVQRAIMPDPKDTQDQRSLKESYQKHYAAFVQNNALIHSKRSHDSPPNMRRLCYEHLPALVTATGITYRDIFEAVSLTPAGAYQPPGWSTEAETQMCACCDLLTSDDKQNIYNLIKSLLCPKFLDIPAELAPVERLMRAVNLRAYSTWSAKNQARCLDLLPQYMQSRGKYKYNTIDFSLLPFVAVQYDVSLHWLLGLSSDYPVLAASGDTEMIMDMFCFLPTESKNIVTKAVDLFLTRRAKNG